MADIATDTGAHICLSAPIRQAITEFYATALSLGGKNDGPPCDREAAITTYFAAFI